MANLWVLLEEGRCRVLAGGKGVRIDVGEWVKGSWGVAREAREGIEERKGARRPGWGDGSAWKGGRPEGIWMFDINCSGILSACDRIVGLPKMSGVLPTARISSSGDNACDSDLLRDWNDVKEFVSFLRNFDLPHIRFDTLDIEAARSTSS